MIVYKVFDDKGELGAKSAGFYTAKELADTWKGRVETENGKVVYQYKERPILNLQEVK